MRATILSVAAIFTLTASVVAFAAEKATGVVKSYDSAGHMLTLDNGGTFMLEGKARRSN